MLPATGSSKPAHRIVHRRHYICDYSLPWSCSAEASGTSATPSQRRGRWNIQADSMIFRYSFLKLLFTERQSSSYLLEAQDKDQVLSLMDSVATLCIISVSKTDGLNVALFSESSLTANFLLWKGIFLALLNHLLCSQWHRCISQTHLSKATKLQKDLKRRSKSSRSKQMWESHPTPYKVILKIC